MNIKDLVADSYAIAHSKGFHHLECTFGDLIALVHSECSEALEAYRDKCPINELMFNDKGKPLGIPSELADIVIRVADMCGIYKIDLEAAIKAKMDYNRTRTFLHGGRAM